MTTDTQERADAPGGVRPVVLAAVDLRKRYGDLEAVRGVSFEIREGETYGLLGPNGAGKTTTIAMICGLLARDGGSVTVDGRLIDVGAVAAKAGIGYVPQELAIYPDLTRAREPRVLRPPVRARRRGLRARIDDVLERRRPDRPGEGPHGDLQRRHAAPAQHRDRAAPPATAAAARRADGGRRPAEPQRHPRVHRRPGSRGHGDPVHDPLHGRGGAPVRPHRDHRRGRDPRRGHAA